MTVLNLTESDEGAGSRIARLSGTEARNAVFSNMYRRRLAGLSVSPLQNVNQVACLIKHSEIYMVQRRWGYEEFLTEAEKLSFEKFLAANDANYANGAQFRAFLMRAIRVIGVIRG